jgi:hypothetical protein
LCTYFKEFYIKLQKIKKMVLKQLLGNFIHLLVIQYLLLVIQYLLLVIQYLLLEIQYLLLIIQYLLLVLPI